MELETQFAESKLDGAKAVTVQRQHVFFKDKAALKNLNDDSGVQEWKDDKNIAGDRCASCRAHSPEIGR